MYMDNRGLHGDAMYDESIEQDYDKASWEAEKKAYLATVEGKYNTSMEAKENRISNDTEVKGLPDDYVLLIGQLENDTSMLFNPIQRMQQLVDEVATALPDTTIVYRPHPISVARNRHKVTLPGNVVLVSKSPLYATMRAARAVVGLNSTVLLEAALIGKPAIAMGDGVWKSHQSTIIRTDKVNLRNTLAICTQEEVDWSRRDAFIRHLFHIQVQMDKPVFNDRNKKVLLV